MLTGSLKIGLFLKLGMTGLLVVGCQAAPVAIQQAAPHLERLSIQPEMVLGYALHTMAWDHQELWQVVQQNGESLLVAQSPFTQKARAIKLSKVMRQHIGLTYGLGAFWLLDFEDKLYQISPKGEVLNEIQLEAEDLNGFVQVTTYQDQLWLFHRSYVSKAAVQEDGFFLQIDPKSGKTLKKLIPSTSRLSGFLVPNLTSHNGFFYIARSSLLHPSHNVLFQVNIATGETLEKQIEKTYTGIPTLFFHQDKLYAVETLDLGEECADNCKGRIQPFSETVPLTH